MAKENAPADQFYWADLTRDTGMLSPAAHGAWCRFLAMTWFTKPRGWFKGELAAYARMFGSTTDHADALIREILRYGVGSLGTETADVRSIVEAWDGDAVQDCHGNVTLVNRRKFREWQEQEAARIRQARRRAGHKDDDEEHMSRDCHAIVTPPSSSSTSSSTSDLKRLIDACVREHSDADARLVETAVLETWMKWRDSPTATPIKSARYFAEEIGLMLKHGGALSSQAVDARLASRRARAGIVHAAEVCRA